MDAYTYKAALSLVIGCSCDSGQMPIYKVYFKSFTVDDPYSYTCIEDFRRHTGVAKSSGAFEWCIKQKSPKHLSVLGGFA